jgi:type IV secretion system protein TrbL
LDGVVWRAIITFFSQLSKAIVFVWFFYALIQFGGQWIPDILNGFIELGQQTGVNSLDPSSVINQGASISGAIFKGFFNWGLLGHPFVSLVGAVVCVAILVLYALIAAELTIVLVKSYAVTAVGGLFFAFGANDYTRDMSKKYFQAIIGLGLNLMTLYLLLGVGQTIGNTWADMTAKAAQNHELMPMLIILGAVIVYYLLVKNIPAFVAGLSGVGGFRNYGDAAVGAAINAGMMSANALLKANNISGKGMQGLSQLASGAMHAANSFSQGYHSTTGSHMTGFSKGTGFNQLKQGMQHMSKHVGGAAMNTVKDMALKQNKHFSVGQKFNHHIANRVKST